MTATTAKVEYEARRATRRDEAMAARPADTKVCTRCKGFGTRKGWAATGYSCARCGGKGYTLGADANLAHCLKRAEASLEELTERGKAMAADKAGREGLAGIRGWTKAQERRLVSLRSAWREVSGYVKALRALVGTSPTLTQIRAAGGVHYGSTHV